MTQLELVALLRQYPVSHFRAQVSAASVRLPRRQVPLALVRPLAC